MPALDPSTALTQLTEGLAALTAQHPLLEARLTQIDAALHDIRQAMRAPAHPRPVASPWPTRLLYSGAGLAVGAVLAALTVLLAWPVPDTTAALQALDSVIVRQYPTLPKPTQEQLTTTYTAHRLMPPDQRQGKH
jgi:ferric-dicitrate binding protein FerR (iron transport regulator)